MRRRQHRQQIAPTQNLDSFLDILTNTVGVLMFVSLFVSLVAVQSATIVRTPLVSKTQKTPQFFEVRGNRVVYIDREAATTQIDKFTESLATCEKPIAPDELDSINIQDYTYQLQRYRECIEYKAEQVKNFRAKTSHYEVGIELDPLGLVYKPLEETAGESTKELILADSEFQRVIKKLNPEKYYLAFIVRPDSFEAFRRTRELALKDGFNVGWEPMNASTSISFSSGGRKVGVQ